MQTPTPVNVVTVTEDSWLIIDLPEDATQLEYGTEVYRLVCNACHGDVGQGLTDDWRAQWPPNEQNCWQSKCHASNYPPDGFSMPIAPAVVGPPLLIFDTALDLYKYISIKMPWHNPGSMTKKENWSVTAYILKINNVNPGPELNTQSAVEIKLRESIQIAPIETVFSPTPEFQSTSSLPNLSHPNENVDDTFGIMVGIAIIILVGGILILWHTIRRNQSKS